MSLSRGIFRITAFLFLCVYFIIFYAPDEQDFVFLNQKLVIINSSDGTESDLSDQLRYNTKSPFHIILEWYDFKINQTEFIRYPIGSLISTVPFANSSHINRAPPPRPWEPLYKN
jgi:hypothetical protein